MGRPAFELVLTIVALAGITAGYWLLARVAVPRPNSAIGYALGITGFAMMLGTETLYSLRKRAKGLQFGPMNAWLQVHTFLGIVGPYLVLLHSGWRFHGLAGYAAAVLGVVVLSGLVGRYLFASAPHYLDGIETPAGRLDGNAADRKRMKQEIRSQERARRLFALWHVCHIPLSAGLFVLAAAHIGGAVYYAILAR